MLRVFGTTTSPYVRRVRIVAHELGLAHELVDTATDEGQAELRARSPIWKVPAAEFDGALVFDSRVINQLLVARHGGASMATIAIDDLESNNLLTVIDGILDALINCFYLAKDGVTPEHASYLAKHQARAAAAMDWLESRVVDGRLGPDRRSDLVEVAAGTMAAWMRFRDTYDVNRHPGLVALLERCEARESFSLTRP